MVGISDDLRLRAAVHAALGEPARLAIAERLALGDASPGELGAQFDLPTNLLAHHLRALEDAELISRRRSAGDRRRSYVQLALDAPGASQLVVSLPTTLLPGAAKGAPTTARVVFVCADNAARSPLAAAVWARTSPVPALSAAGIHPAARVHPRAVRIGRRHGLHLDESATAHLPDVVRAGDLVVAVCDIAHEKLIGAETRLHWSVPDPAPIDTDAAFEAAYQQIAERVDWLAQAVAAEPAG